MPHLRIVTNVDKSKFDESFLQEMTKTMAQLCGKPEKVRRLTADAIGDRIPKVERPPLFVMISVRANEVMSFSGTTDPAACVKFSSIGRIDPTYNAKYSEALFQMLSEKGIPSDRVYLIYKNLEAENVGWNGNLFG